MDGFSHLRRLLVVPGIFRTRLKTSTWLFLSSCLVTSVCSSGNAVQLLRSIHDSMEVLANFISSHMNVDFIRSHLPLLAGVLGMVFCFSILPLDLMEKGLRVVLWECLYNIGDDVMIHMNPLLSFLRSQWESDNHYSVCGSPDRTMPVSYKDMQMTMSQKTKGKCGYSFIRLMMELEIQSGKRIDLAYQGKTMVPPMESFSSDAQIKTLTLDLLRPVGSIDNAIFNLLNAASQKLKYVINKTLPASIRSP